MPAGGKTGPRECTKSYWQHCADPAEAIYGALVDAPVKLITTQIRRWSGNIAPQSSAGCRSAFSAAAAIAASGPLQAADNEHEYAAER